MLQKYSFCLIQLLRKQGRSAFVRMQVLHESSVCGDDICLIEPLLGETKHRTGLPYIHCIAGGARRPPGIGRVSAIEPRQAS